MGSQGWAQRILARFSRITSSGRFIPEVDGLRFLAILSVVLFHLQIYAGQKLGVAPAWAWVDEILKQGNFGVQLFFVISGFILALPFAEYRLRGQASPPSLRAYVLRRLKRLEPPYLLNLLLLLLLSCLVKGDSIREMAPHLLASALYVHNQAYGAVSTINAVAWSLEVEVQFYIVMPALACVYGIRPALLRRALLLSAILLCSACSCWVLPQAFGVYGSLLNFLHYFLAGLLLADVYVADWREQPEHLARWDLAVVLGGLATVLMLVDRMGEVLLPFSVLLIYAGVFRGVVFRRLLTLPVIVTIGGMCYTIYLYHFAFISALGRVLPAAPSPWPLGIDQALRLLLVLLGVLAGAALLFIGFERPFMRRACKTLDFLSSSDETEGSGLRIPPTHLSSEVEAARTVSP